MHFRKHWIWSVFLLVVVLQPLRAQQSVSLLTCAPGDYLYNMFGHNGLCVRDTQTGQAIVYDYGIFDFNTPNFYLKFARGQLLYQVGKRPLDRFVAFYRRNNMEVRERPLKLAAAERDRLIELLETNYLPENRYYHYDFFFDNCATRIRDIILESLEQPPDALVAEAPLPSYRDQLHAYTLRYPWIGMGLDILLGVPADRSADYWEQMYLPYFLEQHLLGLNNSERQLVTDPPQRLNQGQNVLPQPYPLLPPTFWVMLALSLGLIGLAWRSTVFRRIFQTLFPILFGLVGLFLLLMWLGTDHGTTKWNWNVLWAQPLYLLFFVFRNRATQRWILGTIGIGIVAWFVLGLVGIQYLHPAFLPLAALPLVACWWRRMPSAERTK